MDEPRDADPLGSDHLAHEHELLEHDVDRDLLDEPVLPLLGLSVSTMLAVFVGGALGTVARDELAVHHPIGPGGFPWVTLLVNLTATWAPCSSTSWPPSPEAWHWWWLATDSGAGPSPMSASPPLGVALLVALAGGTGAVLRADHSPHRSAPSRPAAVRHPRGERLRLADVGHRDRSRPLTRCRWPGPRGGRPRPVRGLHHLVRRELGDDPSAPHRAPRGSDRVHARRARRLPRCGGRRCRAQRPSLKSSAAEG